MATFTVPDNCSGIDMEDGTEYKARGRKIYVDNPDHIVAIRRAWVRKVGFMDESTYYVRSRDEGNRCSNSHCHFVGFSWQTRCPRCDGKLVGDNIVEKIDGMPIVSETV